MKKSATLRATSLIAVMTVVLVLLLSITSCSFIDSVVSMISGTYSISFDGVEIPIEDVSVKTGEVPIIPEVPEKAGYSGVWTLDGENFDATAAFEYGKNITLLASYTPITYSVIFKADGVQVGETLTYTVENNTITAPAVPEKDGYRGAWEAYTLTTGNVTVNAIYIANTDTSYTVEHYIENASGEYELHSSEVFTGKTDTAVTVDALTIERYIAKEATASGKIAGDGSLVLKLYYDIIRFTVTFDYANSQDNTEIKVKYGETVSADSATLDSRYPFAFLGWQRDGAEYDFSAPVIEDITLTAAYENEYIFDDAEGKITWTPNKSTTTVSAVTDGAISGSQSMQLSVGGTYQGVYKLNLDSIDFSDVNYVFMKVRYDTAARLLVRFINSNDPYGNYIQFAQDISVDGRWHLVCIDMNALFMSANFDKESIKTFFILSDKLVNATIDDIVFVNDKSLYKQDIIAHYDFETQGVWSATGTGNTATYVTEGAIKGQSLQGTLTAWNGLFNNKVAGLFADANYIYLKIKGVSSNPSIRLYQTAWVSNDFYTATGVTVDTKGDYRIVRYDIGDLSALAAKGSADFEKSAISSLFIGSLATASTFIIDDVIISSVELDFPFEVIFKADGIPVGKPQTYTPDDMDITVPEVPAKEGYTGEWESYVLGEGNVVVNAIYTPITYTVTFVADGVTVATFNYTVEDKNVIAPAVPAKDNHTGEWESYTLTTGDVIVNAIYTETHEFKLIFVADGVIISEQIFTEVDKNVTEPDVPAKAGYVGVWESYTLDNSDVTVNAVYTPNTDTQYKVEHYIEKPDGSYELYSSETLAGTTDTDAIANAIAIENYIAKEASVSGNIAGDGSLVLKLYYDILRYSVTFDYATSQEDTVVEIKSGETVSADSAALDSRYPYAFLGWQKDGVEYDFSAPVTEDITLTAKYANEYVYDNFETEGTWNKSNATTVTYTHITSGAISGNQSLQFTAPQYGAINRQNLNTKIDFTDVNYIFLKVRTSANVRLTFRFVNANAFSGTQVQIGYDVKADGAWHTICIDMNSIFTSDAAFGKDAIKSFVIMTGAAATITLDDILFVNDKSLYEQGITSNYDFETQGGWTATGTGNTATYVTDGAIDGQSLQGSLTAWNGLVNQNAAGLFADANYIYLKIKGVSSNPSVRLYKSIGISNDYYSVTGTTVATKADYRIVRYDISDWSKLTVKGAADFTKSEVNTFFIGSLASAATFVIDDVIISSSEIEFPYEVIFKADGVQVGEAQSYTKDNMEITVPEVPAKAGYTGAWESYVLGNGDVTVNAIYTPITYIATFVADGVTVGTVEFTIEDTEIVAPEVPAKENHIGVWESYTLTASDITINAIYTTVTDAQYKVEHYIEKLDGTYELYSSETLVGTIDEAVTANAIAIDHYVAKEASVSGNIAIDGSLVLKLYYDLAKVSVTFDYATSQEDTVVEVKYGAAASTDSVVSNPMYPYAIIGWQKDGAEYDFSAPVTEDITLTAKYANEYVYDDFETKGKWNATNASTVTYTHITSGALSGNQSLQFTAPQYGGIYRQNLNTLVDFTDVNYIFVKVRANTNVRVTFRFLNVNAFSGTNVQAGYDIKADGGWHTICIDMNSVFGSGAAFGKDAIKTLLVMTGAAATVTLDDIVFVSDKSLYEQGITSNYDFETQGGWTATGTGNTATYVTDGAIDGQSLQGSLTAWNGLVNQNAAGLFADANYIYLKIKGVSSNPSVRLYKSIGISNDYYSVTGTTVATKADYRIVRYDISDWSKLTVKGAADFTKSEVNTFFIGSLASAATFVIDDVIISSSEIEFPYEVIFKADGVQVGEAQSYTKDNMEITVPEVPAKAGYTGAWESYVLGNGDVTVNAIYTPITYIATFVADGVTVGTVEFTIEDTEIVAPEVPAKENHIGVWESYTLTASDITINAIYTTVTDAQYKVEHYIEKLDGTYELYSSETLVGTIDEAVTANAIAIDHYVAKEASVSGNIAIDGSLVLKLYYDLAKVSVTFDYATSQEDTVVEVKYGAAASTDSVVSNPMYPYAIIGWQKDGAEYDFSVPVTEDITLTAKYANEYVYDNFETEGTWNKSNATTVTYTHITSGAISGNQSLQFTAPQYGAINRQNLNTKIDFTDVNYIFLKVRTSANVRLTFRFVNANAFSGTQVQIGYDVKADGGWHTICIDMNSIFTSDAAFGKDAIKSFVIMTGAAATVTLDDIVFVNDKSLYNAGVIAHYDFETEGNWTASGTGAVTSYITEGAINGQSLQCEIPAWNGVYNTRVTGSVTDANYIYLKINGVSSNPSIRLYKDTWISTNYYQASGVTVATKDGYRIVRYDISDLSALTVKGTADYGKSDVNMLFIGSLASAATFVIDDVIISTTELSFE